jgi:hypothetical protein
VKISERGGESIRTGRNFHWSGKFFKLEWPTCFVKPQKSSCWQCLAGWHIHCSLENWEDCMVSTRGNRDQKISFYFIFYCRPFFYLARLERSTVKNGTKKRKVDPPFTRRYRFTWRQNEKEDVAPLGVAFGRINLGRMRNDSRHRGRSTGPRESVKKGGFGDGRGGLGSTIGLRRAISLL